MLLLAGIIHYLLPLAALISLIWGLSKKAIYYIIAALWLSLIALILHYQHSGGAILGSYFDYVFGTFHGYHSSNDLCPECCFSI